MSLQRYRAVRFETDFEEGRTHPLVLACRSNNPEAKSVSMVVKAIGCPEINRDWQLVTELAGNIIARHLGIITPEPAIVEISGPVANLINQSEKVKASGFQVLPGDAAGCAYTSMVPYTTNQTLGPEGRDQAVRIFLFDLLTQNFDRRPDKVNCGISAEGLIAFDFELCYAHKFLPVIGGNPEPWKPSEAGSLAQNHLFRHVAKTNPPSKETVTEMLGKLSSSWWHSVIDTLPTDWQGEAASIGADLNAVASHAEDFYMDIVTRCLT